MLKPVDVDQQSHMITHLTGFSAPMHTHDTMEMGTVLHRFGKLKPVPIPMHTHDTLSQVYPYLCHALIVIDRVGGMDSERISLNILLELCNKGVAG